MELLDIKFDQVNEWLVLRRKIDKNWAKYLKPIETKHSLLITKLTSDKTLSSLLPQELSGYLQSKEVLKSLEKTENLDKSKTMFGNYSNEFLYDWETLSRSYEKNNLHLSDCGKHLLQLGMYDVPSFKSAESSLEKQLRELQHKESQISEEIQKKEKFFKEKCKNYEIQGDNIQYELKEKTRKIPEIYLNIIDLLKSQELSTIISTYEEVTKTNHNSQVNLPVISSIKTFIFSGDLENLKNKYCALIHSQEVTELEDFDWKIETVDEEEKEKEEPKGLEKGPDLPLESKEMRSELINELVELQAFCEGYDMSCDVIRKVLNLLVNVRELVLIHEQDNYSDRIVQDFNRILNHNLAEKLIECRKMQSTIQASLKENREKLVQLLKFSESLISFLETSINKLFPNVSIKIIGEIVKDIKSLLR